MASLMISDFSQLTNERAKKKQDDYPMRFRFHVIYIMIAILSKQGLSKVNLFFNHLNFYIYQIVTNQCLEFGVTKVPKVNIYNRMNQFLL